MPQARTAEQAFDELYGKKKSRMAEDAFSDLYGGQSATQDVPRGTGDTSYRLGPFLDVSEPPKPWLKGYDHLTPQYSEDTDVRRQQMFDEAVTQLPSQQRANVLRGQEYRTPAEELGGTAPALNFAQRALTGAQGASTLRGLVGRLGLAVGDDPNRQFFGVGPTFGEMAEEPQLAAGVLEALPPTTTTEAVAQGGGAGMTTVQELMTPGSPMSAVGNFSARMGTKLAGRFGVEIPTRGLLGKAAQLSLASPGFTAPAALSGVLGGELTPWEAVKEVAASPVTVPWQLAKTAVQAPQDIASGDPERMAKGLAEGAALAAPLAIKGAKAVVGKGPSSPLLSEPGIKQYAEPFINAVGRQGGKVGRFLEGKARRVVAGTAGGEGESASNIRQIEKLFRKNPATDIVAPIKGTKAADKSITRARLSEPETYDAFGTGVAQSRELLEGGRAPANSRESVYQRYMDRILGKQASEFREAGGETVGHKPQPRASTGTAGAEIAGAVAGPLTKRAPRIFKPEFFGLMRDGGPVWQRWLESHAVNNGKTPQEVDAIVKEMQSPKAERTIALEVARKLPWMATHIKGENGKPIELMVSDPLDYAYAATNYVAARTNFIDQFGQKTRGKAVGEFGEYVDKLRGRFITAGGNEGDFNNLMHALNQRSPNITATPVSHSKPGTLRDLFKQGVYSARRVRNALNLSSSAFPNIPEPAGSTFASYPAGDVARGTANLTSKYATTRDRLIGKGVITRRPMDFHLKKGEKIASAGRIVSDLLMTGFGVRPINEAQETLGGAVGEAFSERLRTTGKGSGFDANLLKTFQFTQPQVSALISGKAPQSLYNEVARRITARHYGSTAQMAEKSLAQNSPVVRSVVPFQSYFQTQLQLADRIAKNVVDAHRHGDARAKFASYRQAANFIAGKALAGEGVLMLTSLIAGKDIDRSDESIPERIGKDLLSAFSGTPLTMLYQATSEGGAISDLVKTMLPDIRTMDEAKQMVLGEGKYSEMETPEKVHTFLKSQTAITKSQRGVMAAIGVVNPKMESAVSDYWKWRRANKPIQKNVGAVDDAKFRRGMSKAVDMIRNGNTEEALGEMAVAVKGGKDLKDVRGALDDRRLLQGWKPEEKAALKKGIGEKRYGMIEIHDGLIDNFNWKSSRAWEFQAKTRELRQRQGSGTITPKEKAVLSAMGNNANLARMIRDKMDVTTDQTKLKGLKRKLDRLLDKGVSVFDRKLSEKDLED